MIIKKFGRFNERESAVTDEVIFLKRRELLKSMGFVGMSSLLAQHSHAGIFDIFSKDESKVVSEFERVALNDVRKNSEPHDEALTPEQKVLGYNNFYEFGTSKTAPKTMAQGMRVDPWTLRIDGEVRKPLTLGYEDLFKRFDLEERIYRLRCVEAWSMVIPWIGFSLRDLIQWAEPNSKAKYVSFETLADKEQMPGVRNPYLGGNIDYPYVEGLRLDEANNPLTLMSVGLYGKTLAPQNGAPVRLVVPWKYGFKSIKSIVGIRFTEKQPPSTWNSLASSEYGFYANVNPGVDHPRWSQKTERRITTGGLFDQTRINTELFNGYAEQVAPLYKDMDLRKFY